ncbi:hypothetical protein DRN67_04650 [Candidatus Micrarchaeota archaeon]|mgnify:CR=1 FL=1|nr:MAG: hypothetical protein DRN67_04650 [Candidatus Micrarchaeota archaeon]
MFMLRLKHPRFGLETEFLIVDEAGQPTNSADILLEACKNKRAGAYMHQEVSKCQIELGASPKRTVRRTTKGFLTTLNEIIEVAEDLDLRLLPLGAYPGKMVPKARKKEWYEMQAKMIGVKKWYGVLSRVCGFHFHYRLPKGTFDWNKWKLKRVLRSATARALVNQYNLLIAADPAIMTLTQSSPFYNGHYYCKDTRMALYRDVELEKPEIKGIHHDLSIIASLPRYEHTITDMNHRIDTRKQFWLDALKKSHPSMYKLAKKANPLRFYWGAVRINRAGTFEHRGMDINLISNLIGVSALLKGCLMAVESERLKIVPSEIGIRQPFRMEENKVYVPPFSYLKNHLQIDAIKQGMESSKIQDYCKRFYRFAIGFLDYPHDLALGSIKTMINDGKTVSDEMIKYVKKRGEKLDEEIDQGLCAELALRYAEELKHEIPKLLSHYIALDVGES